MTNNNNADNTATNKKADEVAAKKTNATAKAEQVQKVEVVSDVDVIDESSYKFTIGFVLSRIDKIINAKAFIQETLDLLSQMDMGSFDEDEDVEQLRNARIEAIGAIVSSRERTNQQALRLFEKMYDDLRNTKNIPDLNPTTQAKYLSTVKEVLEFSKSIDWSEIPPELHNAIKNAIANQLAKTY